jgi:site-specific DNA-methyltransferase (adenine-specific)
MGRVNIHHGDAIEWAKEYKGEPFHALFSDAPYEMDFMGHEWDSSGVAFDPETWRAFARILYPGAFLFVFAGTINDDLISYAMRSAGLRKFHKMMGWAYGSGFPKGSRVNHGSEKTETFAGHRYGLQALKPAIETILIFQKPYDGKPIDNITSTGAGALNIDEGRIPGLADKPNGPIHPKRGNHLGWDVDNIFIEAPDPHPLGRWPSNFILLDEEAARALDEQSGERPVSGSAKNGRPATGDNYSNETHIFAGVGKKQGTLHNDSGGASRFFFRSEEQIDEGDPLGRWPSNFLLLDEEAARALDEQSGELKSGSDGISPRKINTNLYGGGRGLQISEDMATHYGDIGGASRFFFRSEEQIDEGDPVRYIAKASKAEREAGLLDVIPCSKCGKVGTKTHINEEGREVKCLRNIHSTIKPLSLCKYLAGILLPPIEYAPRRIVIPFAGVMSEAIGAAQAGWEEVEAIELTEEYIPIGSARVAYWANKPIESKKTKKVKESKKSDPAPNKPEQKELF